MDEFLERVYLEQAKQECTACFAALTAFNLAIQTKTNEDPFIHAMAFVHRAASASRILWPPGGFNKKSVERSKRRGDHLRSSLNIEDTHPIKSRRLRDHFEHFDERLDEWAEKSKHRNMVTRFIGPRSAIGGTGIEESDVIIQYDPSSKIFSFRGQDFDIQALATGISDLNQRIDERLAAINIHLFGARPL